MNVHESEKLYAAFAREGVTAADGMENADIIVFNTCCVREGAETRVLGNLGPVKRLKAERPDIIVAVCGCMTQQADVADKLHKRCPFINIITGTYSLGALPQMVKAVEAGEKFILDLAVDESVPGGVDEAAPSVGVNRFVNIMYGCNNFCTYCIVPYVKGRERSRRAEDIRRETEMLVRGGAKEITLLGQNVNVFGNDKSGDGTTFPELLRQVAAIPGLRRIRFVSAHPRDFSQETIDMFAELPQLCPRLHLPLQSGSDSMLKKMGRGYTMERYLSVVEGLRKARPDIALSTDLIVGFPSETEEEFEDTLKAVDSCGFMSSFSFCYSDRPGTRASAMPFKIPHDVQLERLERLQSLQNDRAEAWLKSRVGLVTDVLLEGPSQRRTEDNNEWQGRDPWGDMVNVRMPEGEGRPGQFVDVKITGANKWSLSGEPA